MKRAICMLISCCFVVALAAQNNSIGAKQESKKQVVQNGDKAYFSLATKELNFGEIAVGDSKTIELSFTNNGKKTLVLNEVYTNCGCTTIDYPREAFTVGKSGIIKVTYTPTEEGPFNKSITICTNASNDTEVVKIKGFGIEK